MSSTTALSPAESFRLWTVCQLHRNRNRRTQPARCSSTSIALFDTETLVSGSATSIGTSSLAAGTHSVSATYSGDTNNAGSTGTLSGGQVVNSAGASVSVGSGLNPSTYGQSVTFTATITSDNGLAKGRNRKNGMKPLDVTGRVTWSANTGCGTSVTSGNPGTATCTTSSLAVGSDTVTANYTVATAITTRVGFGKPDGQPSQHKNGGCFELESVRIWPGSKLHGHGDGSESDGNGAVQRRRQPVRYGDTGSGHRPLRSAHRRWRRGRTR